MTEVKNAPPPSAAVPNPSTHGPLGGKIAPNPDGRLQTTIDSKTTTIHPNSTITGRVEPDGTAHAHKE